jgi:Ala-tRNA(Pro) deacylase
MVKNPYLLIKQSLDRNGIDYQELEHEPVYTSKQAAEVRGESLDEGAKSLVLKIGNSFILVVLPGSKRLSSKKVKDLFNVSEFRFARPEEVVSVM